MQKKLSLLIFLFLVTAHITIFPFAQAAALIPAPPSLSSKSYVLMDINSGELLVDYASEIQLEPASLTKIMTAYIVSMEINGGVLQEDELVLVSKKAWQQEGSRMFIEVGKQVSVIDLLRGIIIQSGNDASVAIAEHVAGSEMAFADLMNQQAQQLDMVNSHFVNVTGLPHADHYTTAKDLALLTKALIEDFPDHYAIYSEKSFTFNDISQYNRNKLLWRDLSVDGVKTGHTKSAGYGLVTSASRNGMRLISVVLGTHSMEARAQESQSLLSYGYRFFETHKLYNAGETLDTARVWYGEKEKLAIGLLEDLFITIPRSQKQHLKANITISALVEAPVNKGQNLGVLEVTLEDQQIVQRPLYALQEMPSGSWWSRLIDWLMLLLDALIN